MLVVSRENYIRTCVHFNSPRAAVARCQNGGQLLELLEELGYVDASDAILDALREAGAAACRFRGACTS